jgi:hypothetical protein
MEHVMKKLPIGIQTFEKLIRENCLYIDKTRSIFQMIDQGSVYFLSRPRRFGKSLLLTTLEAIFQGKKELFKGLWIYDSEYQWQTYPVIRITFSGISFSTLKTLEDNINHQLSEIAQKFQVKLEYTTFYERFRELIRKLSDIENVVVLIDEYDKPILDVIHEPELAQANRDTLRTFYTVLKDADPYLRFVFLTGVSKFSKVSVFSGLNHLNDISMARDYAEMLGYTQEELERYFAEHMEELAREQEVDRETLLPLIRRWYNGYQFSTRPVRVYNPFSVLLLFTQKEFRNYWFETGTPSFLINLIKKYDYDIPAIEHLEVAEPAFSTYEIDDLRVEPLLYQTGYITITAHNREDRLYTLGYPNLEVKQAFLEYLVDSVSPVRRELASSYIVKLIKALRSAAMENFFEVLRVFFADIPYDIQLKHEKYYQTIFYLVFTLLGLRIESEVSTNKGRIDAVLLTSEKTFLFEFKLYDSAETALEQIKTLEYFQKYKQRGKPLVLVGVAFDSETRNIGNWVVEHI